MPAGFSWAGEVKSPRAPRTAFASGSKPSMDGSKALEESVIAACRTDPGLAGEAAINRYVTTVPMSGNTYFSKAKV